MEKKTFEERNFLLVQLIEQEPCLYDKCSPEYSRRDKTDLAWFRISQEMKESVAECKEKWKHIRTVFLRHIAKPSSGTGAKKRPYYLYDALHFMMPHLKVTKQQEVNLPGRITEKKPETSEVPDDPTERADDENITHKAQGSSNTSIGHKPRSQTKRLRLMEAPDPVDSCLIEYIKRQSKPKTPDADEEFLHSLLPDVKMLNARQKRKFKIGVLKLIDDICESPEDGSSARSSRLLTYSPTLQTPPL